MTFKPTPQEKLDEALALYEQYGHSIKRAAEAAGMPATTLRDRLRVIRDGPRKRNAPKALRQTSLYSRHFVVTDTQDKPGAPKDHLKWVGQAIVDYAPDVVVHIGDHWDMPSLNMHELPGSAFMEGQQFNEDIECGNRSWRTLFAPMYAEMEKTGWDPERHFTVGNHEDRADRFAAMNPRFRHLISTDKMRTEDFQRHKFGDIVDIGGVLYSHFFSNPHSGRAIGGTPQNRLNKICQSFVMGHVQGLEIGSKLTPTGKTMHGVVAGSCYLHRESYRGVHQKHFRGVVILNEVRDGDFCIMPLSLAYLCRKYENMELRAYMEGEHPDEDWSHLGD